MPSGVLFALSAYALYSCCDAITKSLGSSMSVFELAFFTTLFSLLPVMVTKPKGEHWRYFWVMANPKLVMLRGFSGLVSNLCVVYAFFTIPLADVYSLAFLAPVFIVFISVFVLKETVSWQRWVFLGISFLGVLLVVRPGFRDLHLGHLAAIMSAISGSITTSVLRRVALQEARVTLIGVVSAYILIVDGALMMLDFHMPSAIDFAWMLAIGGLGGTANILFIAATRRSPASQIAPVQYSQIAWAVLFGAVFFAEFPDGFAYVGLVVVIVAGILNVISGGNPTRIFSRSSPGGTGPATTAAEAAAVDAALEGVIAGAAEAAATER